MVKVQNLFHDYEGKGQWAVEDISFRIEKGEIFGFLGPSGAGKSTVQNIMTALLPIQRGEIFYNELSIREISRSFFNRIGYSFEHANVHSRLTGYENLKFFAGLFDCPTEDPIKLLDMVGLKNAAHKRAGRYSKGMKQRLVFCRGIINSPEILFLDEPLSGLDPSTAGRIKEIILKQKKAGTTVILTTHNMFAADELCDKVAFINEGKIVAMDTPRNMKLRYGEKAVKVEYSEKGKVQSRLFSLEGEREELKAFLDRPEVQTIHSREASLEDIFVRLTGRGLV